MATLLKSFNGLTLFNRHLKQSVDITAIPCRWSKRTNPAPKKRHPEWLPKPQRVLYKEDLTEDNKQFIQEIIRDKYGPPNIGFGMQESPLKINPIEPIPTWTPKSRRVGLIARKIGIYPLWMKNGKKVSSTLLQIVDNQVVKYIPPEECNPVITKPRPIKNKLGCIIVGAQTIDPQLVTKEYYNMFDESGVPPKRILMRFYVTPDAALQPGTQLYAAHFQPGSAVDIRAKTIDRGFQGVMKRWGFKGMPASHGTTKTHRRPGNIGSGGEKARVVPGTKLPGHMGNRWRTIKGYRILRVNTKYNVIWVQGQNIPGETNSFCYIFDTVLPLRKNENPYFPTYLPGVTAETIPDDLYVDDIHQFNEATIEYSSES